MCDGFLTTNYDDSLLPPLLLNLFQHLKTGYILNNKCTVR